MKPSVAATFSLTLFILILMVDSSAQKYAWRPQGRFGKRLVAAAQDKMPEMPSASSMRLHSNLLDSLEDIDLPFFKAGDIVCARTENSGLYRCLRWARDENTETSNVGL